MKKLTVVLVCALTAALLSFGGAFAAASVQEREETVIDEAYDPMDIWPPEVGED